MAANVEALEAGAEIIKKATARTQGYLPAIEAVRAEGGNVTAAAFPTTDLGPAFAAVERYAGKVRDVYVLPDGRAVLIATGRQSAFDRALATIPFKGQVLNLTSLWWFENTKHIIPNHLIASPHPCVAVCKRCEVFQIEFVVRGYLTGSTSTAIWTNYKNGAREYCGIPLPDGMVKNQKLETNLLTPSTKDAVHDMPISEAEIVASGRMTAEDLAKCKEAALALFAFGQATAASRGLILVDTKYEFGRDPATGEVTLVDEVMTPDSSRYWVASTYAERHARGEEPENIDKEFLRLWFAERCDPYKDATLPEAPTELVCELSRRYVMLYELITGERLQFPSNADPASAPAMSDAAIAEALVAYLGAK